MGGFFQKTLLHVLALSIGTLSVGFGLSYYGASVATCLEGFNLNTKFKKSIFNALCTICAAITSSFVNFAIQKYGRKKPAMLASGIVAFGYILIICTKTSYNFLAYIGRAITGFGCGAISTINPVYIAEISPTEVRGSYGVMSQLFTAFGGTLIYLMGIWLHWRAIAIVAIIPPAINIIALFFFPESPAFNRMDDTVKKNQVNLFQMKYMKAWIISLLVVIFQQFSGINALQTNLNVIFGTSSIDLDPAIASVIVSFSKVITTACSTPLVEKFGRKFTWWISSIGQGIFLLVLWANEKWHFSSIVPVVFLFLDLLFFGIGLGPIPWFIIPELFPDEVRGLAMGSLQTINWGLAAVNVFIFPIMQESMTLAWIYFFYGAIMIASFFYGVFFLPETRNTEMGQMIKEDEEKKKKSELYDSDESSEERLSYI